MIGSYLLLARTAFGLRIRASLENPALARASGISTNAIYGATFAFGAALAGLAGALIVPVFSLFADLGLRFLIQGFVAVMVGGVGSFAGPVAGAGVIGTLGRRAAMDHSARDRRRPRVRSRHHLHQVSAARPAFSKGGLVHVQRPQQSQPPAISLQFRLCQHRHRHGRRQLGRPPRLGECGVGPDQGRHRDRSDRSDRLCRQRRRECRKDGDQGNQRRRRVAWPAAGTVHRGHRVE